MAIHARGVVARRRIVAPRRRLRIVFAARRRRRICFCRFRSPAAARGGSRVPSAAIFCASGVSGGMRPFGGSTIMRGARAGALHGHEHRAIGAGDIELGAALHALVAPEQRRALLVQFGALFGREEFLVGVFGGALQRRVGFDRSRCPAGPVRPKPCVARIAEWTDQHLRRQRTAAAQAATRSRRKERWTTNNSHLRLPIERCDQPHYQRRAGNRPAD